MAGAYELTTMQEEVHKRKIVLSDDYLCPCLASAETKMKSLSHPGAVRYPKKLCARSLSGTQCEIEKPTHD